MRKLRKAEYERHLEAAGAGHPDRRPAVELPPLLGRPARERYTGPVKPIRERY